MPDPDVPARGFALSDFDIPNPPPDDTPKVEPVATTPAAGGGTTIEEPPIKDLVADDEFKKDDLADGEGANPPESLTSAMDRAPGAAREEAEQIAADKKKKDDDAAAKAAIPEADRAKADEAAAGKAKRDADLEVELGAHTRPTTRKTITEFQAKAKAARDERDAIAAEREALRKERDDLAAKVKAAPLPKEVEDEVKTLRERVRELDITKDPIIQQKYDARMQANEKSILDTLKAQGFGMVIDPDTKKPVENPAAIAELVKSGLNLKTLTPLLKKLEAADLVEEAETIRDAIRQNRGLATEKQQEIDRWKADHTTRQQVRETATKQQTEAQQAAYTQQTDTQYRAELETLSKDFGFLKQPPAPLATDTPAVAKAKQAALDEYNAAASKIEADVKGLNPAGIAPEKLPEVIGKINAQAILAITLKNHVLPNLLRRQASDAARIKELEADLAKIRGAGRMSRLQGGAPGDAAPAGGGNQATDIGQALLAAMPGAQG